MPAGSRLLLRGGAWLCEAAELSPHTQRTHNKGSSEMYQKSGCAGHAYSRLDPLGQLMSEERTSI